MQLNQQQIQDNEAPNTKSELQQLGQIIENLSSSELEALIKQVKLDFTRGMIAITQNYKLIIHSNLEICEQDLLNKFNQKSQILNWLLQKLEEIPQKKEYQQRNLVALQKQEIILRCGALKNFISALIDQIQKDFQDEIPHQETKEQHIFDFVKQELVQSDKCVRFTEVLQKIDCFQCSSSGHDVTSLRRHLRREHQTVFIKYKCNQCELEIKACEDFCNHLIRVHGIMSCPCGAILQIKSQLFDHLRACQKFYKKSDYPLTRKLVQQNRVSENQHKVEC